MDGWSILAVVVGISVVLFILRSAAALALSYRSYQLRRRLAEFRRNHLEQLKKSHPDVSIDRQQDVQSWVEEVLSARLR